MARYLKLEQNHNGTRTFSISPSIFITFRLFLSRQVFSFDFAKWFHSIPFYISPSFSISPKSAISPSFQFRQVYEGKSLLAKCRKLAKWRNWRNLHDWQNRVLPRCSTGIWVRNDQKIINQNKLTNWDTPAGIVNWRTYQPYLLRQVLLVLYELLAMTTIHLDHF